MSVLSRLPSAAVEGSARQPRPAALSPPRRLLQPARASIPIGQLAELADVPLFSPTGVPLVDGLMKLPSVAAACRRSLVLLALLVATGLLGTLLLRPLASVADGQLSNPGRGFNFKVALLASALQPLRALLPLYCAARAATVVLAFAQVAATKLGGQLMPEAMEAAGKAGTLGSSGGALLRWVGLAAGCSDVTAPEVLPAVQMLAQLVQDCSELVFITLMAWFVHGFKNQVIAFYTTRIQQDMDPHNDGLVPLLRLLSQALDTLILMAAAAVTLVGFGVNINPLLASIGGVSVVVGLATQALLSNVVAALSLYITRPFVAGDKVQLVNPEGVEIEGTVLNIEPTRTIMMDDATGCTVHVDNNALVGEFVIRNYTQYGSKERLAELQEAAGSAGAVLLAARAAAHCDGSTSGDASDGNGATGTADSCAGVPVGSS